MMPPRNPDAIRERPSRRATHSPDCIRATGYGSCVGAGHARENVAAQKHRGHGTGRPPRSYRGIAMLPDLSLGPLAHVLFVGCAVRTMVIAIGAHNLGGPAVLYGEIA